MTMAIEVKNLSKMYRSKKALSNLNFIIEENKITGLVGRNGAGKTTLLKTMAGFLKPTSGQITVYNHEPFDNLAIAANTIFMSDEMTYNPALKLTEILDAAERFYPNFVKEHADRLLNYFSINPNTYQTKLSKGMKNTFNLILALSARTPLTLLDEPMTGMDAAVRKDMYRAILKEYLLFPRTIILSSHLIDEMVDLLEDVLLIDGGKLILHLPMDEYKEYAISMTGKTDILSKLSNLEIIQEQELLGGKSTIIARRTPDLISEATALGLHCLPVSVSDISMYLTTKSNGGIDDVFARD